CVHSDSSFRFTFCSLSRYLFSFPTRRSSDLAGAFLVSSDVRHWILGTAGDRRGGTDRHRPAKAAARRAHRRAPRRPAAALRCRRSEEHTSELQSPYDLVCRLLLEKNKSMSTN